MKLGQNRPKIDLSYRSVGQWRFMMKVCDRIFTWDYYRLYISFFFQPMRGKGNCSIVPSEMTVIGGVEWNFGPIAMKWRWNSRHHDETLSPSSFYITSYSKLNYIYNSTHTPACYTCHYVLQSSNTRLRIQCTTLREHFNNHTQTFYYKPRLCFLSCNFSQGLTKQTVADLN
jgi:hypothetical protein